MKLVLHIGPHKTATTAIQQLLAANPAPLEAAGFVYEKFDELNGGAHQFADLISVGKIESLEAIFSRLADCQTNLIISSENFSRLSGPQAKELLGKLKAFDVRVVYYLRNPLDRVYSNWQELVKHGFRYTFLEYVANVLSKPFMSDVLNPTVHLQAWRSAAGAEAVEVVLYDHVSNITEDFVSRFTQAKGIKSPSGTRVNASFSPEKTEVLRALAGVQQALLNYRGFNAEIEEIASMLKNAKDKSSKSFSRTFSLSWDSAILRSVEKGICRSLDFLPDDQDILFETRDKEYRYYVNTVWQEHDELGNLLAGLRKSILNKFDNIPFDERLRFM